MQHLPPGQSIALLEQLTHALQTIFLAKFPPLSTADPPDVVQNQVTRKKRKRNEMKNRETPTFLSQNEGTSHCFLAALLYGVDIMSWVLLNTSLTQWTSQGLHRERAMAALLAVKRDVCTPLVQAAAAVVSWW